MSRFLVTRGTPEPLGVVADAGGVNVAVWSAHADAIEFCLFDAEGERETARIRLPERSGDVFHGRVAGINVGTRYGLRAHGPWDPARGHRFNPSKLLVDPFASGIDRPFKLDPAMFDTDALNPADSAAAMPKGIVGAPETIPAHRAPVSLDGQIVYEVHVRGFTQCHPDIPPALRGTFAGLAHPAAIEHLRRLGITAVELMPAAAWLDERHLPPLGLSNYWGYNPVAFLAPDPRLAPGGWAEIRAAVATLQGAGIAVLLDVVFNHTGEGDHLGPTVSLRGLDNASYYRLLPGDPSRYVNDTGCGHTLALDRPPMLRLAMEALRCWTTRAGVDGFRFDLATTLGRRADGFDPDAPLFQAIDQDPVLRDRVLIAEPWDVGEGGYRLGAFPDRWGEWNDRFRDTARRFWRGDAGMVGELATRFAGSADIFGARHRPASCSINFVTIHDGFTLADLVAHEHKHNEANGEHNRDGTDDNHSWNRGVEGPSDDPVIGAARAADVRALLATLLLARGTPMLSMGDECGRTQQGNNNAYSQDNAISWFDWAGADQVLTGFTARLVAARRGCEALTGTRPLTGGPVDASGIPDVTWQTPDGHAMTVADWQAPDNRSLIAVLYEAGSRAVVVLHGGSEPARVALPPPRPGHRWYLVVDSQRPERQEEVEQEFAAGARSVLLVVEMAAG